MAVALLGERFDPETAARGVAGMQTVYGRGEVIRTPEGEELELLMMKNPPSMQVNLDALPGTPEQVMVAVDEGTPDPSWVYGTDFSRIDRVDVVTGSKCWQFATRFAYDGIDVDAVIPELGPALERFLHVLADEQLAEVLQVRQAVEEQDPLDQPIGVLHLVDRLVVRVLAELLQAPVLEHAGVQEVLVDRRELVLQYAIEMPQYERVALHVEPPVRAKRRS